MEIYQKKQEKIVNTLNCQLIYQIMEDYLDIEYVNIEFKKIILVNDYNISAQKMALKLKTMLNFKKLIICKIIL